MAMILNGHMKEASMNSLLEDPLNSRSSEVGPSPADVAWADSCLNIDEILLSRENGPRPGLNFSEDENLILDDDIIEVSEDDKESLALGKRNGKVRARNQLDHSVFRPNYTEDIGKMELFASDLDLSSTSYEVEQDIFKVWDLGISDDELDDDIIEVSEDDKESLALGKRNGKMRARNQLDHSVFRPNYTEGIGKMELFASDLDLSSTSYEVEQDIFKVWDLGISDDELDVFSESNQVLREVPWIQYNDSSTSRKDSFNVSLDDLIAGLDHLSLTRHLNDPLI